MDVEVLNDAVFQEDLDFVADHFLDKALIRGKVFYITGATGLIGSSLVKSLLCMNRKYTLGLKVIAQVRNQTKANRVYDSVLMRDDLIFHVTDFKDELTIDYPIDYIIHTVSVTASRMYVENPVDTIMTAIDSSNTVLKFAKDKAVSSFVYLSSMEVYGFIDLGESRVDETKLGYIDHLKVRSSYSESKRMVECLTISYASQYGVKAKIARLAQTFGAGADVNDGRVFAQFTKSCLKNENIVLHTKGLSYGNFCYTADVVLGILTILLRGSDGEAYNIVNEATTMQIKDMAKVASLALTNGKVDVEFNIPHDLDTFGYAPDTALRLSGEKLMRLGWEPHFDLPQMFRRLAQSFENQRKTK